MKSIKKDISCRITTPQIKLDQLLKLSGVASTGGHAKVMIINNEVKVNGESCLLRGKKIVPGDIVETDEYRIIVTDC